MRSPAPQACWEATSSTIARATTTRTRQRSPRTTPGRWRCNGITACRRIQRRASTSRSSTIAGRASSPMRMTRLRISERKRANEILHIEDRGDLLYRRARADGMQLHGEPGRGIAVSGAAGLAVVTGYHGLHAVLAPAVQRSRGAHALQVAEAARDERGLFERADAGLAEGRTDSKP